MSAGREAVEVAVQFRAVAQGLEAPGPKSWAYLDSLLKDAVAACNALLALRDRTPGAPEHGNVVSLASRHRHRIVGPRNDHGGAA